MRPSFRVVFAVIAALTVSMIVSADSQCTAPGDYCTMDKDQCCSGFKCVPELSITDNDGTVVSMSSFIQDLLTHRRGRQKAPYICVTPYELR
ncbi:hypothetical protein BDR07DRAFT_1398317 [Suillus spraguei]|nr:hypothetical protein BDR07DRAFT_1430843 [Suillus spraguei]KAG2365659.1 hypothetical protein BDR07DRAFT_1398317 [Suillus spraguei]